jgi:hypothetical protein
MQLSDTGVTDFSSEQTDWNHSDDAAPSGETRVREGAHEPDAASAIDQVQSLFGYEGAKDLSRFFVTFVRRSRGSAEDTY